MIGQWDPALFAQYRQAPEGGAIQRAIGNRLYIENEPLVKRLVAQMIGQGKPRPGLRIPAALRRLHRAENVESWEDAMGAASIAFTKLLRDYDPAKGAVSYFLGMKIKYELQELISRSTNVKTPRDTPDDEAPRGFDRYDTEADFERDTNDGTAEMAPDRLVELAEEARSAEEQAAPILAPRPQSALADFLQKHCRFHRTFTVAHSSIVGAYERHARAVMFPALPQKLLGLLQKAGARPQTVRVPWNDAPVRGFRGVALQSDAGNAV